MKRIAATGLVSLAILGSAAAQFQSRPAAMGLNGAASTPHPLATEAAIRALRSGGNAVDAAVVAAAVSAVVQPFTSGVGGIGYATVCEAATGRVRILDFSGRTTAETRPDLFPVKEGQVDFRELEKRRHNQRATLVPGVVAGWQELLKMAGTFSLAAALEPAIELAEEGFPVSYLLSRTMASQQARLAGWPDSARAFLKQGLAYAPGEILKQPALAATLRAVADHGAEAFYGGAVARRLVESVRAQGGTFTAEDLAGYRVRRLEPIQASYRGYTVYGAPPPGSDAVFLQALAVLSLFDDGPSQFGAASYVHRSVEATKLARTDRIRFFGDPEFVPEIPLAMLLSREYAARQKARINLSQARAGDPQPPTPDSHTIQLCTVDRRGNAVNLLQTVGLPFGNAVVAGDTGILMNSMLYFSAADPNLPNAIGPGRRIERNPLTVMVRDPEGRLRLMLGSPGGKTVIQTVRQMLINVLDFGMNIQAAIDAPRFLSQPDGITVSLLCPVCFRRYAVLLCATCAVGVDRFRIYRRAGLFRRHPGLGGVRRLRDVADPALWTAAGCRLFSRLFSTAAGRRTGLRNPSRRRQKRLFHGDPMEPQDTLGVVVPLCPFPGDEFLGHWLDEDPWVFQSLSDLGRASSRGGTE